MTKMSCFASNAIRLLITAFVVSFCFVAMSNTSTSPMGREVVSPSIEPAFNAPSEASLARSNKLMNATAAIASPFAPSITATKTDTLFTDLDLDTKADPGDTLLYTITISASGMDAAGLAFNDTVDSNTTLVAGSVTATPVAVNDSYTATGNVQITIPAASGVLTNDFLGIPAPATASAGATSTNGGAVMMNSDGSFTYNPPAGFDGTDTFTYTLTNSAGSNQATVTFTVSGMIWFIDNSLAMNGDGRLTAPFNSVGNFNAGATDEAGDNIFLYRQTGTNYSGSLTLLNGQRLIGQGATASLSMITGITPPMGSLALPATGGTNPVIAGNVTLGQGNLIRGLNISAGSGTALMGANFSSFTASECSVSNTGGGAISLTHSTGTGSLSATFVSVSATGGANGIFLQNTTGSFTVNGDGTNTARGGNSTGGTIANTTGANGTTGGIGVYLNNAQGVALRRMTINGTNQNFGIYGTNVTNFVMEYSAVSGANGNSVPDREGAVVFDNVFGNANLINESVISGAIEDNLRIQNTSSTPLTSFTISNNNIQNNSTVSGNIGARFASFNSANMTGIISGNSFSGNRTDTINCDGANSSQLNITISNNTITRGAGGNNEGNLGINVTAGATAQVTFDVDNNNVGTPDGTTNSSLMNTGINIFAGNNSTMTGRVRNNKIINRGAGFNGHGIDVFGDLLSAINIKVDNNTISNVGLDFGLRVQANGDPSNAGGQIQAGVTNNNVSVLSTAIDAIRIRSRRQTSLCTRVTGNTAGPGGSGFFGLFLAQSDTSIFNLEGGAANLAANNPGTAPANISTVGTINNVSTNSCSSIPAAVFLEARTETILIRSETTNLTEDELSGILATAIARWEAAGISYEESAKLGAVIFKVVELPDRYLSQGDEKEIFIDRTAAGFGWFVDQTPFDDWEFEQPLSAVTLESSESAAHSRMDLLTVVMNALGQVLEIHRAKAASEHSDSQLADQGREFHPINQSRELMQMTLPSGVRRLPANKPIGQADKSPSTLISSITSSAPSVNEKDSLFALNDRLFNIRRVSANVGANSTPARYAMRTRSTGAATPISGEAVPTVNIGTLPVGKSVTITFRVMIDNPFPVGVCEVSNQGTITGSNFSSLVTDDPDTATPNDSTKTTIPSPPIIGACPVNITANTDAGQCTATVNFTAPTATGCPTPTVTCNPASGFAFPKGMTSVTCTASNSEGSAMCSFTVTVNDNQPPVVTCPSPITTGTDSGMCSAVVNFMSTATDNCDGAITPVCSPASGTAFPKGITTVMCSATDTSSNVGSCSFTVTVNDDDAPVVTCPAPISMNSPMGMCSVAVTFTATALDNCDGVITPTCVPASGANFPRGITTVTCTATDTSSNTGNCSFTVTIIDNQPPVLTCPSPIVTGTDPTMCSAVVMFTATATDNCDGSITPVCTPASGATFPKGITTVMCTATDTSSNVGSCSFTVTVNDDDAPVVTCPAPISMNSPAGMCSVSVTFTATALDNCDGAITPTCTPPSGTTFPRGITTVTCTATDTSSNTGNCSFTVTVIDDDAPVVMCPSPISVNTDTGMCSAVVNYTATAMDNCDGMITPVCAPASGTTFPKGITTVTCTATDSATNTANCSFTVTVNDGVAPVVTCPSPIVTGTDSTMCSAVVNFTATATDNCDGMLTPVCTPASGATFPKGITTVMCTATDASSNTSNCSFTVTVNDDDAPVVTCPSPMITGTAGGLCSAVVMFTATAMDNCDGALTPVCTPPSGSTFPKGTTTVSCTATDTSANTGNCSFTVTVVDDDAPVVTCPSAMMTGTAGGMCSAVVTFSATATDNCDGTLTPTCVPPSGTAFPKGITTVTCMAADTSANMGNCTFTVTVVDDDPPTIVCPPTQVAPPGVVTYPAPTFADNCPGATVVCNPPSGSMFPAGFTTVTCTVMDAAGNSAGCSFLVTTFDQAIVSDSGGGSIFINTLTGDYMICCGGMIISGKGTITKKGCVMTLTHNPPDRRLTVTYDTCKKEGKAVLQMPPGTVKCTIIDSDTRNSIVAPCS